MCDILIKTICFVTIFKLKLTDALGFGLEEI